MIKYRRATEREKGSEKDLVESDNEIAMNLPRLRIDKVLLFAVVSVNSNFAGMLSKGGSRLFRSVAAGNWRGQQQRTTNE